VIALEGQFTLNFLRGVLATVNPCGFVLLPTYLMFFLGMEGARPGTQRATLQRALVVSLAVSSGFFAVFVVIGVLFQAGIARFQEHYDWFGFVVGLGLIALGIAIVFGLKLKLFTPRLQAGGKDRTLVGMFLYGVSYAVASLGCTLPLFLPALASVSRNGYASAVLATLLYGLGMAVTLTALTVSLALARTGMLKVMRGVMPHLDLVAGVLMILTGVYLAWYWGSEINQAGSDKGAAVEQVESWQEKVQNWLNDLGVWPIAMVCGGIVAAAVLYVVIRRNRPPRAAG
jgi:cytochrome c biogenesis protein CcdA